MTTKKSILLTQTLNNPGFGIILLTAIAVFADFTFELLRIRSTSSGYIQIFTSFREFWQSSTGNEFTGEVTAVLFSASMIPVAFNLISKTISRYDYFGESIKGPLRRINNFQRKHLMCLHTYLSIPALGLGILHLTLSQCLANPFPELGLLLSAILVASGLLFKWKIIPSSIRKSLYQFHASLIVSGVLLVLLYVGHAVMGSD